MRQARQQEPHLLRLPLALPAGHQAQGLLVLAAGRCDHGAAIVGIGEGHGRVIGQRGHQYHLRIPALLLGGTAHPRARGPPEPVGLQDGGDLTSGA